MFLSNEIRLMKPLVQTFDINSSLLFFVEELGNAESKKAKTFVNQR